MTANYTDSELERAMSNSLGPFTPHTVSIAEAKLYHIM